ncbi:MAG: hypothetical protein AB8F95_19080 [Bacteroidia bacterium]
MLRSVIHIILAGLVLLSSSGVIVQKHYCFGKLRSTSLFTEAEKCAGAEVPNIEPFKPILHHDSFNKKSCCDDSKAFFHVDFQENLTAIQVVDIQCFMPGETTVLSPYSDIALSFNIERYKPPLLFCNLSVRFQNFLC